MKSQQVAAASVRVACLLSSCPTPALCDVATLTSQAVSEWLLRYHLSKLLVPSQRKTPRLHRLTVDVQWTCNGRAMDVQWTCNGRVEFTAISAFEELVTYIQVLENQSFAESAVISTRPLHVHCTSIGRPLHVHWTSTAEHVT